MSRTAINYKAIIRILGVIIFIIGLSIIIPWAYAEKTGDGVCAHAFRRCAPLLIVIGAFFTFTFSSRRAKFRIREGYIIVTLCWLLSSFTGAFPYYFSDFTDSFTTAFFESTSGFTTTGCTANHAALCHALLLWKAISHWLGGMGILVFVISILPALGINGQFIARAETPGPVLEKMTVRISDSAKILYITYLTFTIIEFLMLDLSGKMPAFDALITTMGSISTAGLMVHPEGIAYYGSIYVEVVICVFCILASVNFILYHYVATGKASYLFRDVELRAYLIIIGVSILICTAGLYLNSSSSLGSSLRDSFFQVVSMATTSGYSRSPYTIWPSVCQITLMTLMFIGGCAASTSGSIKVIRVLVMLKLIGRGCVKRIHPRSVVAVKIGKNPISASVVSGITVFILTYMLLLITSCFVLSFQGIDLETSVTAALAMISNTGAAFGETASLGNFAYFHPVLRIYLSGLMIIGRLELFTVIILFTRNFWGKER